LLGILGIFGGEEGAAMPDGSFIPSFIHQFGYLGLALGLIANCLGIPIASEIVLPLSGVYAVSVGLDLTTVVIISILAQMIGFTIAYYLALKGGVGLLERYGKYLFINHRQIIKFHKAFKKHGFGLILLGSCIPGVHGYMGYTAGLAEMSLPSFLVTGFFGSTVWSIVLVGLGAIFKEPISSVASAIAGVGSLTVISLVFIILSIWYIKQRKLKKRRKKT
jgi:membrane protein DedA with SNARE-associated domain